MDKDEVIAWLRRQTDKVYFEVVYAGASGRGPDEHDRGWREAHVVVGWAVREREEATESKPWTPEFVALPRGPVAPDDNEILCEAGHHCGQALVSWAKEIACPLCGQETYAT